MSVFFGQSGRLAPGAACLDLPTRSRARASSRAGLAAVIAFGLTTGLGGCASSVGNWSTNVAEAPMFPESQWGVAASTRVIPAEQPVPRGGGVYKVGAPYKVGNLWYQPREQPDYDRVGIASWYGSDFHGRKTANGEVFDMHGLTAAHPTLPMPSYVYVTNVANNRKVLVRVNDRGPYVAGRIIDLSKAAAHAIGLKDTGTGHVRVRYAGPAPLDGNDRRERDHLAGRDWGAQQPTRVASMQAAPVLYAPPPSQAYDPAGAGGYGAAPGYQGMPAQTGSNRAVADAYVPQQPQYSAAPPAEPQGAGMSGWSAQAYRAGLAGRR